MDFLVQFFYWSQREKCWNYQPEFWICLYFLNSTRFYFVYSEDLLLIHVHLAFFVYSDESILLSLCKFPLYPRKYFCSEVHFSDINIATPSSFLLISICMGSSNFQSVMPASEITQRSTGFLSPTLVSLSAPSPILNPSPELASFLREGNCLQA